MADIVVDLLSDFAGWAVFDRIRLRRARKRLKDEACVACAFRAVAARVSGIGTEWSHGEARLKPGVIHFMPKKGVVGDRDIAVVSLDRSQARRPTGKEAWSSVAPELEIWRLVTPQGDLEWAVHYKLIEVAAATLAHVPT